MASATKGTKDDSPWGGSPSFQSKAFCAASGQRGLNFGNIPDLVSLILTSLEQEPQEAMKLKPVPCRQRKI